VALVVLLRALPLPLGFGDFHLKFVTTHGFAVHFPDCCFSVDWVMILNKGKITLHSEVNYLTISIELVLQVLLPDVARHPANVNLGIGLVLASVFSPLGLLCAFH
jgi:hypothetical protein